VFWHFSPKPGYRCQRTRGLDHSFGQKAASRSQGRSRITLLCGFCCFEGFKHSVCSCGRGLQGGPLNRLLNGLRILIKAAPQQQIYIPNSYICTIEAGPLFRSRTEPPCCTPSPPIQLFEPPPLPHTSCLSAQVTREESVIYCVVCCLEQEQTAVVHTCGTPGCNLRWIAQQQLCLGVSYILPDRCHGRTLAAAVTCSA